MDNVGIKSKKGIDQTQPPTQTTNTTTTMNTYIATVKTAMNGQPSFCFYTPAKAPLKSTRYEWILGKVEASSWGQALRAAECLYYKTN